MNKIKSAIKKIPLLRNIAMYFYKNVYGTSEFRNSGEYWENRYKLGGDSGAGSYNILAEFKAEVINEFVKKNDIETVIEFGCGDGNQLKYFNFKSYIGFDVSRTAINKCRDMYESDSTKQFETLESYNKEKADLVLSLDVIYHLIEDITYFDYMKKLFSSSNKYVIIYSSNDDEHENNNVAAHVKHRKFTNWVEHNAPNFRMIKQIPNKHPFNGINEVSSYADFFIFQIQD
ncbi:methyltransferase domain-containing protein [Cryomorphaceae bacterium 1068]|nr:methyltransferase domain-containing protein [Cryomorphaceae bacterium 1068]